MTSKISQDIEMSDLTFNGRKIKKGGKYLKKNGELRKKFKANFKLYQNKLYNTTGTKSFKFSGKKYTKNDIDYYDGLQLDNAYLINELIKRNGFTGETRIIIKKNNKIISDKDYDLEELKSGISEEFNDGQSPYKIYNRNLTKKDKIEIILAKSNKIPPGFYEQNFLDAIERHCFLSDIGDYYEKMKVQKDEEGLCSKKATAILNKINGKKNKPGLLTEYETGIPESKLNEVCDYLGIGIEISLPFQKEPLKTYRPSANNFYGKVFKYLNTRLNHLEHAENFSHTDIFYKSFDPTYVSFNELQEIVQDLLEMNEYVAYKKGSFGIISAKTKDKYYLIEDEKTQAFSDFDNDTGLRWTKYDVIKYPLLKKFVDYGTHFNGTIDFKDTSELDSVIEVNGQADLGLRHIDQEKAYSQFYHSQFYDGFMGKITDFRKHTGLAKVHGFYYVVNLDFTKCNPKFRGLNQKLVWFKNHNVYTKQELDCLTFHGGSYDTKFACFGTKIDFRFSDTMLNTKYTVERAGENFKIPYYSLWTGTQASTKTKNNFYMKGDHKYFSRYTKHDIWYNDASDETKIVFDNPICYSNKHISAQIVAYQRLVLLEQLMMLDTDKVIRVCVDGIYVENHDFDIHHCFREKAAMTFRNSACDTYLSEIAMTENEDLTIQLNALPEARDYYYRELHRGAGGTGKSYKNLNDMGFIHGVYVPHSWKLASNVSGMKKLVHHSINHDDKINSWSKKYNVYFGDECSMMTEFDKEFWFKNIMGRIILMGDPECQLLPIYEKKKRDSEVKQDERRFKQMASTGFDYILDYNIVYRFNCSVLLNVTEKLRYFIKHPRKWNFNECKKILGFFKNIHITLLRDCHYDYKKDIILVARNKGKHSNEDYNEIFKEQDKFKVTENKFGHNNGDVVFEKVKGVRCEKRHGFTIHSVQGETYRNKIFIDLHHILEKGFIPYTDLRMFYTAVSRATKIENIFLVI